MLAVLCRNLTSQLTNGILTSYRVHTSMYYYVIRGNQNPRGVQRESPSRLEEGFWRECWDFLRLSFGLELALGEEGKDCSNLEYVYTF